MRNSAVALAEANRDRLKGQFDAACHRLDAAGKRGELDEFLRQISEWTVSMNMRGDDLDAFIDLGYHRNVVHKTVDEWTAYQELGGDPHRVPLPEESMALNDPGWFPRRSAYRDLIHNEENFKYGAFYAGGEGLAKYGQYVVVLRREKVQGYQYVCVLREDSLLYVDAGNQVDTQRFERELARKDNAHELAVVKHEQDLMRGCRAALARLCYAHSDTDRSYLEVQIEDEVTRDHIGRIRIIPSYRRELMDIAEAKLKAMYNLGQAKDRDELGHWTKFQRLNKKARIFGITIE